jgi:hypothetical protein
MATPTRPTESRGTPRRPNGETNFNRSLRFEFAGEEGRALIGSYAISIGLAIAFLLLVYLSPTRVSNPILQQPEPIQVTFNDVVPPEPPPTEPVVPQSGEATATPAPGPTNRPPGRVGPKGNPRPGRPGSRMEQSSTGAVGDAFGTGTGSGTGGMVGDVSGILRGVAVNSGSGGTGGGIAGTGGGGTGGKAVLGYGQGGQGSQTPGRGGIGGGTGTGGGGGGGIGGVGAGGGVTRAQVRVAAPAVVSAENLGGPGRDVSELGTFVRSRESQLRFCYVEQGLKVNPNLAGTVNVAITLTGTGNVTGVAINNRTWSGPGSSEAEACIRSKIRSWKFPSSAAGAGTYSFPFNFTK